MNTVFPPALLEQFAGRVCIGHHTDAAARTGCTVVLFDRLLPTVVDARGGAPGTRETDVFAAGRLVQSADAILLTGGSAFGLAAAGGVMRVLAERGRGFPTIAGPVPIVPAAVLYDLEIGDPIAPDAAAGRAAVAAAQDLAAVARGQVGAGTGATIGKIGGRHERGGIGLFVAGYPRGAVLAVTAVNAFGDVVNPRTGDLLAPRPGVTTAAEARERVLRGHPGASGLGESTTLAVVVIAGPSSRDSLVRCAIAAHDALSHIIRPCHTVFDGDIVFATGLSPGEPDAATILEQSLATEAAVEAAVIDAATAVSGAASIGETDDP